MQFICKASSAYCYMVDSMLKALGLTPLRTTGGEQPVGNIVFYAGRIDGELEGFLNSVAGHGLRVIIGVEHGGVVEKRVLKKIINIRRAGLEILVTASTMKDYRVLREEMPDVNVVYIPLHAPGSSVMRDLLPSDGGIATHSDECGRIVEVAGELEAVGFNPLIVNFSEKECSASSPWVINVATDSVFNLSSRIVIGVILDESASSYMVFDALYRNSRPLIVCSDMDIPVDSQMVIKTGRCSVDELASTIISLFSRIEYYRRIGSERPASTVAGRGMDALKEFIDGMRRQV
ncbi:hypothetical protein [Desulfurococcus mucosus]|uniref:Uncharacterized protein n=1 Tax=Desulfurococcus mucosus (strain ATCC 35584 / DSM 2162 / JCM 9187 / O7/1) TaxID=765177 RepID=E8R723_DESM0|nr:hypothetical protein [Desulfurococcus mucosus]ADV64456.1 hypothetical protein Desmu_0137 [Desulfurococcus mucosus DSM 2162]